MTSLCNSRPSMGVGIFFGLPTLPCLEVREVNPQPTVISLNRESWWRVPRPGYQWSRRRHHCSHEASSKPHLLCMLMCTSRFDDVIVTTGLEYTFCVGKEKSAIKYSVRKMHRCCLPKLRLSILSGWVSPYNINQLSVYLQMQIGLNLEVIHTSSVCRTLPSKICWQLWRNSDDVTLLLLFKRLRESLQSLCTELSHWVFFKSKTFVRCHALPVHFCRVPLRRFLESIASYRVYADVYNLGDVM